MQGAFNDLKRKITDNQFFSFNEKYPDSEEFRIAEDLFQKLEGVIPNNLIFKRESRIIFHILSNFMQTGRKLSDPLTHIIDKGFTLAEVDDYIFIYTTNQLGREVIDVILKQISELNRKTNKQLMDLYKEKLNGHNIVEFSISLLDNMRLIELPLLWNISKKDEKFIFELIYKIRKKSYDDPKT